MNSVKLVAYTNPVIEVDDKKMNADEFIAYCARVSNPSNQNNNLTAPKLIRYCINNHHWSIFEMVNVVVEITTTRDIARQILRHRSFSFQEFSQRYADPTTALGFTTREARLQDPKNRQNSIELVNDFERSNLQDEWNFLQQQLVNHSQEAYNWAIKNGIAKEQARSVLPEGLTLSRMYMNGSLRSWIHYCDLRMGNGTQKEHREIATQCYNIITDLFPVLKDD